MASLDTTHEIDTNSSLPVVTTLKISRCGQMAHGGGVGRRGQNAPQLRAERNESAVYVKSRDMKARRKETE